MFFDSARSQAVQIFVHAPMEKPQTRRAVRAQINLLPPRTSSRDVQRVGDSRRLIVIMIES